MRLFGTYLELFPRKNAVSGENGGGGNRTRATFPREIPDVRGVYSIELGGLVIEIRVEGKHTNLHIYEPTDDGEAGIWVFEELEQALPKLRALLTVADDLMLLLRLEKN